MTPQELFAAIDAVRLERGLKWWQVAVQLDISPARVRELCRGVRSPGVAERAPAWLERHTGPPRTE